MKKKPRTGGMKEVSGFLNQCTKCVIILLFCLTARPGSSRSILVNL